MKLNEQRLPQSMPSGVLVTRPSPVPAFPTITLPWRRRLGTAEAEEPNASSARNVAAATTARGSQAELPARDDDARCRRPRPARCAPARPRPSRRASTDGRPPRPARSRSPGPAATRPCRTRCTASGPAADPVAGSSGTPSPGANIRVFQRAPAPAMQFAPRTSGSRASRPRSGASAATASSLSRA